MTDISGEEDTIVLLRRAAEGELAAREAAWARVLDEVLRVAAAQRRAWSGDWTLETRALANEVFLKFYGGGAVTPNDRKHFFVLVSRAVRQILINYAEYKRAAKRGGGLSDETLTDHMTPLLLSPVVHDQVFELHVSLERFSSLDPRAGQVVELRFFAGLTYEEIAEVMGVSRATVVRDWESARAWLNRDLDDD